MKVRLLNDGCFPGLDGVTFPVEVDGVVNPQDCRYALVNGEELMRVGCAQPLNKDFDWPFLVGTECELVEN